MRTIGTLFTCDRCGQEQFDDNAHFPHINKVGVPVNWRWESILDVDLCPDCSSELDKQLKIFLRMDQYELDLTPDTKEVIENEGIS